MHPVKALGIRLVTIRIGIVFNKMGGALAEFMKPAKLGAAAILGDGKPALILEGQDLLKRTRTNSYYTPSASGGKLASL